LESSDEWASQAETQGYNSGNFDMNGQVYNQDKNEYWIDNNEKQTHSPINYKSIIK